MSTAPRRGADVLLLAAHPLELAPFATALGAGMLARVHGVTVAGADVGVGLAAAGGGAARRLAEHTPRAAVLVGSYGVYPDRGVFAPGRVLVPARVCAVDASERSGKAAFPPAMAAAVEPDDALCAAIAGGGNAVERGTLATTLGITTDDALARELGARADCHGENLEALAVALACRDAGVAFAAVLACTNEVGARGRAQWLQHRGAAAQACTEIVLAWLARGAPGLA